MPRADGAASAALLHTEGITQVAHRLWAQPDEGLSVPQMAQLTHLSPYHFIRVFRQVTGLPPGDFRAAVRLQEAKRLLLSTALDVTDICYAVGYQSVGTFTTRFTQLVGLSPGRLRSLAPNLTIPHALPPCVATPQGGRPARGAVVRGNIRGTGVAPGPLFVGLFPSPIPQGRPVVGTLLHAQGTYLLAGVPDGCYYVVAAALPWSGSPLGYLLPDERLRLGRSAGPLWVRHGRVHGCGDLVLRQIEPTDPPVVVALPSLLYERRH